MSMNKGESDMKSPPVNIVLESERMKSDKAARWLAEHDPQESSKRWLKKHRPRKTRESLRAHLRHKAMA